MKAGERQNNSPVLIDPFCCTVHISKQSNLSSTPRIATGSHQTAGGSPTPRGISPLAWFSRNRPHCLRRITAECRFNARTLGWTGVSLSLLLVMAIPGAIRYWQPAVSRSLLGRTNQRPIFLFRWCLVVFSWQIFAQPLPGLWLSPKQQECA